MPDFQLYTAGYQGFTEGREDKEDNFVVDSLSGHQTSFKLFFPDLTESYVRGLSISNTAAGSFNTIMDSEASAQHLSVYDVPFDLTPNLGLRWRYSLERLPAQDGGNAHVVQVTSRARPENPRLVVEAWTSAGKDGVVDGAAVILYVGVWVGGVPVSGARVTGLLEGRGAGGLPLPSTTLQFMDSGTGDPDIREGDGVYSKYFSNLHSSSRYSLMVTVASTNESPAFTVTSETRGKGQAQQNVGTFTRILQADSFIVPGLLSNWSLARVPPSRILDLSVSVVSSSQQLEFEWSAPGSDYDEGRPTSYLLYQSTDPALYTGTALPPSLLVESFSGVRGAGGREAHRCVTWTFSTDHICAAMLILTIFTG